MVCKLGKCDHFVYSDLANNNLIPHIYGSQRTKIFYPKNLFGLECEAISATEHLQLLLTHLICQLEFNVLYFPHMNFSF